jgi:hypothetical protein
LGESREARANAPIVSRSTRLPPPLDDAMLGLDPG